MEHSVSPPAQRAAFSSPVKGGSETILVIDGARGVHADLADMLRTLGYRVLRARDEHAALDTLQGGGRVDLLVSDFAESDPALAARVRQLVPGIAVLFTSGSKRQGVGAALDPGVEILDRRYDRASLARTVRHVLGNQQQVNALAKALRESRLRRARPARPAGPLAVLLVDDQDDVRDTSRQLLELFDCEVRAVSTAEAAEAELRRARFDVLLTDISLPGRSGIELARAAAQLQPAIQVVLSSGYGNVGADPALEGVPTRRLPKPYGVAEVEALLRELRSA